MPGWCREGAGRVLGALGGCREGARSSGRLPGGAGKLLGGCRQGARRLPGGAGRVPGREGMRFPRVRSGVGMRFPAVREGAGKPWVHLGSTLTPFGANFTVAAQKDVHIYTVKVTFSKICLQIKTVLSNLRHCKNKRLACTRAQFHVSKV